MRVLYFLQLVLWGTVSLGAPAQTRIDFNAKDVEQMARHNTQLGRLDNTAASTSVTVLRPFAEYEPTKYLLFSTSTNFGSKAIKDLMVKELPQDVVLVLYGSSQPSLEQKASHYKQWIDASRIRKVKVPSEAFWSRDVNPVPVFLEKNVGLVDAKYGHGHEPDAQIASHFGYTRLHHEYYFEGGNLIADTHGNCFMVNGARTSAIPNFLFETKYGCKKILRLSKKGGIGHIDERIKIVSDNLALTDTKDYVGTLENLGYTVIEVPRPGDTFQTYMNSLLINGTLFVPIYGHENDEKALEAYAVSGMNIVPIDSTSLSRGKGSIHCITMTYPDIPFGRVLDMLDGFEF